jgi:hypothetical protein
MGSLRTRRGGSSTWDEPLNPVFPHEEAWNCPSVLLIPARPFNFHSDASSGAVIRRHLECSIVCTALRKCGIVARCDRDETQSELWRRVSSCRQPSACYHRQVSSSSFPKTHRVPYFFGFLATCDANVTNHESAPQLPLVRMEASDSRCLDLRKKDYSL